MEPQGAAAFCGCFAPVQMYGREGCTISWINRILFIAHALTKTLQVDALFEMGTSGLKPSGEAGRLRTVIARGSS